MEVPTVQRRTWNAALAGAFVTLVTLVTLAMLAAGCVTINIYFPAAAAEKAADRIIDEVWQLKGGAPAPAPAPASKPETK